MRVILSRKSMDSSFGGYPSPIFEDGSLLPLPIPGFKKNGDYSYGEVYFKGRPLKKLLKSLGIKPHIKGQPCSHTHLDPDLLKDSLKRKRGWKPAFGQRGGANSHILSQVDVDNEELLFLFFGWFRRFDGEKFYGPHLHLIYGFLEVERHIDLYTQRARVPAGNRDHVHVRAHDLDGQNQNNSLYVGKRGGLFNFDKSLILTKEGQSRSRWHDRDKIFRRFPPTHHKKESWKKKEQYFQSAFIGQEFVFPNSPEVTAWALSKLSL